MRDRFPQVMRGMTLRRRRQRAMEITITNNQRLIKINRRKIKKVLRKTLQYLKDSGKLNPLLVAHYSSLELSVIFVNDKKMRGLNLQYRGKDKTTDVLSFPQYSAEEQKSGRAEEQKHRRKDFRTSALVLGDIVYDSFHKG